jgi:uncharacterized protein YigE (DUF2233 family)
MTPGLSTLLSVVLALCPGAHNRQTGNDRPLVTHEVVGMSLGIVSVHVLRFSPADVEIKLLFPQKEGELQRVEEMAGCMSSLACFNASFFTPENRPLGVLVSEGKRIQRVRRGSWRIFWVGRDRIPRMDSRSEFSWREAEFAVQSGPLMVKGGKVQMDMRASLARRTAIGIDGRGRVVLLVTTLPVSLDALARMAVARLEVRDLLNLDGGSSCQLWMKHSPRARVTGDPVAVGAALSGR